ncbi:GIY-YIG nuclease family protein [Hymenobacter latericus]|uniref:GIY-YIG nuclease family protein n=1 Tax=Hymenobacter sp. YIM 151858-1 TaxID=2987688 RepID=UPI00222765EC|nr:GIY-YIG nuclease family protein [Hymenobacter sp. YIM 151858-1]UYZ57402.1 GIY-YIG nuclease family protein [Hymenobacter sp. YIM 151858-1]
MKYHNYYVYIVTNPKKTVLYIGVTNDMVRRLDEHLENAGKPHTFAGRYWCHLLVHWEHYASVQQAIAREKELKGWGRPKKDALIAAHNPEWKALN